MKTTTAKVKIKVRIAVTGHRKLADETAIEQSLTNMFHELNLLLNPDGDPLYTPNITGYSLLAEGADRLFAHALLSRENTSLIAPLPLPENEYSKTFQNPDSLGEYKNLISKAEEHYVLPVNPEQPYCFQEAGEYLLDTCDLLVAIWDGKPAAGIGGTGELVKSAKKRKMPIVWIHALRPKKIKWWNKRLLMSEWRYYNKHSKTITPDNYINEIIDAIKQTDIPQEQLDSIENNIIPQYLLCDHLARKSKRRTSIVKWLIPTLAFFSLMAIVSKVVFFHGIHPTSWLAPAGLLAWAELFGLGLIYKIWQIQKYFRWHPQFIAYRYLAEHLRLMIFTTPFAITEGGVNRDVHYERKMDLHWMTSFLQEIKSQTVASQPPSENIDTKKIKELIFNHLLDGQISYHHKNSRKFSRRYAQFSTILVLLFLLTYSVAHLHTPGIEKYLPQILKHIPHHFMPWFDFMCIMFPIFAASLATHELNSEYHRESERSEDTLWKIKSIRNKIHDSQDFKQLTTQMDSLATIFRVELYDWYLLQISHPPKLV